MSESTSVGMYQCPCCYGPSEGPGSCSICLAAGPHSHPEPGVIAQRPFTMPEGLPSPQATVVTPVVIAQPEPARPKRRLTVQPEEGGQLEQFLVANKEASDRAAEARDEADEFKSSIKTWLLGVGALLPEGLPDAFDIAADPHGRYPGYTMTLKEGHHLDKEAMVRDGHGDLYERYLVPNKAAWELRESTARQRRPR
jgi:hypothetical protein